MIIFKEIASFPWITPNYQVFGFYSFVLEPVNNIEGMFKFEVSSPFDFNRATNGIKVNKMNNIRNTF